MTQVDTQYRNEIIEMARQAGYKHPDAVGQCEDFAYFNLEDFAKLIAEREREACVEAFELYWNDGGLQRSYSPTDYIRARSKE
jgi:hypothetical protein